MAVADFEEYAPDPADRRAELIQGKVIDVEAEGVLDLDTDLLDAEEDVGQDRAIEPRIS